jgi:hypothetical protein
MQPELYRIFGELFAKKFGPRGFQAVEGSFGQFMLKKAPSSMVQLQQDFDDWAEQVCKPLLVFDAGSGSQATAPADSKKPHKTEGGLLAVEAG